MIDGRRKPASFALRASFDGANCRQSRAKNLFYPSRGEKSFEKAWRTPSASSKAKAEAFASRAASFFQLKKRSRPPMFSSKSSLSLSLLRAGILKTHLTNQRKKAENAIAPRATATWERTAGVIVERRGKKGDSFFLTRGLWFPSAVRRKEKSESRPRGRRVRAKKKLSFRQPRTTETPAMIRPFSRLFILSLSLSLSSLLQKEGGKRHKKVLNKKERGGGGEENRL